MLLLFSLCPGRFVKAQSTAGITGKPDTSFTVGREYEKLKKHYPFIQIVAPLSAGTVTEKKDVVYCTTGSRNLLLDVFSPAQKDNRKRAAILLIHGGGWRSGNRAQHHPMAQKLAQRGYVCFTPEYRLSTEALYPAAVQDLKAALRWISANAKAYNIDTAKIAVAGFSAGGQLAALVGTTIGDPAFEAGDCNGQASSRVRAIIDMDGTLSFVHPESGEGDDSKRTSAATYWFGYAKKENPALWQQASPLAHAGRHTPPTLFINSSVARMHAGRDDFMDTLRRYGIYTGVKTFEGAPHAFPLFHPWFDSTISFMDGFLKTVFAQKRTTASSRITVAQDGSGDFFSVQAAFNAIPQNNQKPVTVFIRNGVYKEKLYLDSTKTNVTLAGEDKFKTVLTFDDHAKKLSPSGDTINTFTSYTFLQEGNDFKARNLTIENSAGNSAGQAVAVHIMGDRVQFDNCRFLGHQDVLYAGKPGTRQYFSGCYIEGTTDFIFGPSIAWFERCHINSKRNSHVTAASTPREQAFGYVFHDCVLTTDSLQVNKVSLGRPWRPYASVAYLHCYMGAHILPEGWNNWRNPENEKTARYAEYGSFGPGANGGARLPWTRQLTAVEAGQYTLKNVLGNWKPSTAYQ